MGVQMKNTSFNEFYLGMRLGEVEYGKEVVSVMRTSGSLVNYRTKGIFKCTAIFQPEVRVS